MSLIQYARFLITGTLVAAITIGCREAIGWLLGSDTAFYYSLSVLISYVIGITLSFFVNQRFTFKQGAPEADVSKFTMFVFVAIVGLISTWLLSLALRYGLGLNRLIGEASAAVAFAAAALLSSLITYPLNALLVFRKTHDGKPARTMPSAP